MSRAAFEAGLAAERRGELASAEMIFGEVVSGSPGEWQPLLRWGVVAAKMGRLDAAASRLTGVLRMKPDCLPALNVLSGVFRESGRLAEALKYANAAVKLAPEDAEACFNLGLCYQRVGKSWEAIESLSRAAWLDPSSSAIAIGLGSAYEESGDQWAALLAYRKAGRSAGALMRLGRLALSVGRIEEAFKCASSVVSVDPSSAPAQLLLAECLEEMGSDASAGEHMAQAYVLDPGLRRAHRKERITRLRELGRFDAAEELLLEAIEEDPQNGSTWWALVSGRRFGASDEGLIDRMESLSGIDPAVQYALGKAYDDLGEWGLAMSRYDRANRLSLGERQFDSAAFAARFDRLIEMFDQQFFAESRDLGSPSEMPIFLMGMMRSGTTLAERILSAHPSVAAGGELGHWPHHGHRVLDLECGVVRRGLLEQAAASYLELLSGIGDGCARVTDKNPANSLLAGLLAVAFPSARMVRMERHPIDTCLSIWFTPASHPAEFANDRSSLVFAVRQFMRLMRHWEAVLPGDRFRTFRYEELVREPSQVSKEMVSFCGLPWDEACLHPESNPGRVNTPCLWQVRQPVHTGSVERWRRYEEWLGEFGEL